MHLNSKESKQTNLDPENKTQTVSPHIMHRIHVPFSSFHPTMARFCGCAACSAGVLVLLAAPPVSLTSVPSLAVWAFLPTSAVGLQHWLLFLTRCGSEHHPSTCLALCRHPLFLVSHDISTPHVFSLRLAKLSEMSVSLADFYQVSHLFTYSSSSPYLSTAFINFCLMLPLLLVVTSCFC